MAEIVLGLNTISQYLGTAFATVEGQRGSISVRCVTGGGGSHSDETSYLHWATKMIRFLESTERTPPHRFDWISPYLLWIE